MKYEKPRVIVLAYPLEAIQAFSKALPIFYDMIWDDPRPSDCAYEADE